MRMYLLGLELELPLVDSESVRRVPSYCSRKKDSMSKPQPFSWLTLGTFQPTLSMACQ